MKEIIYQGENLLIGNIGHFFVVLSFVTAILSALLYWNRGKTEGSLALARGTFVLHAISVIGVFVTLFIIIQSHLFEYHYAWQHSSKSLPVRYMISCFWEGQEGSFLLWLFWQAVLGIVLILTAKKWERGVMIIMSLAQIVLASMLLGISLGDIYTLGSSPFNLLRDAVGDTAPIFQQADYLKFITDGNGLNPLLQNYWMVIHPPVLFLGFALSIVPFAFAVTSLHQNDFRGWLKPALHWTSIAALVLGMGIIMGGFWAYESLSFGGYWAWDPVENASLVPWLLLIAGLHTMLISKSTNTSVIASYLLVISSFILVLYATFLTRSGVLGETSVHSFTDLGLAGQLMQFVVIFIWMPIWAVKQNKTIRLAVAVPTLILILLLPIFNKFAFYPLLILSVLGVVWFAFLLQKQLTPNSNKEESIWSREFWMFIGSLVLLLSAVQITFTTSMPVFNKIFGSSFAAPSDVIDHYNRFQLPIAVVITLLTAFVQFLKYRKTSDTLKFFKHILIALAIAIVLTGVGIFVFSITSPLYIIFLLACFFAITANLLYVTVVLKGKIKFSGASITHIGFATMLIGVLVSSVNQKIITADFTGGLQSFDEKSRKENMLLFKDEPARLGDFLVTYKGDSISGEDIYFEVNYKGLDGKEAFTLWPNAQISDNGGLLANPDTRHYLTYDVYTHITSIPKMPDSLQWKNVQEHTIKIGDTIFLKDAKIVFKGIDQNVKNAQVGNAQLFAGVMDVVKNNKVYVAKPIYALLPATYFSIREEMPEIGLRLGFEIRPSDAGPSAILETAETEPEPKYIVMKAIVFPYINLLWAGAILMLIGFGVAAAHRMKK